MLRGANAGCKRFLACSRQKLWWMNPEWGSTAAEIPNETQFLLFQLASTKGGGGARDEEEGESEMKEEEDVKPIHKYHTHPQILIQ